MIHSQHSGVLLQTNVSARVCVCVNEKDRSSMG